MARAWWSALDDAHRKHWMDLAGAKGTWLMLGKRTWQEKQTALYLPRLHCTLTARPLHPHCTLTALSLQLYCSSTADLKQMYCKSKADVLHLTA